MSRGKDSDVAKANIKELRYIIKYLKPYKAIIVGVLLALVISSSSVLSMGWGIKFLVDKGFSGKDAEILNQALLILLTIITILSISTYARFYLITKLGEKVVADIRRDTYYHLIHLSPGFFESAKTGEIVSRLTTDTTILQMVIGSSLSIALRNLLLLIGGLTLLIITSPKLAGFIAVMIPVIVLPVLMLGKKVRKLSRRAQSKVAKLAGHIDETLDGIKTVQAYGREEIEQSYFSDKVEAVLSAALDRVKLRGALTAIVIFLSFGSVAAILWLGGHDVITGKLSAGALSSFVFYSLIVAGAFGAISEVIGDLQRAAGAAEELFTILNTKSEIYDPESPVELPKDSSGKIAFNNVTFYYPSRKEDPALTDISFDVEANEKIALVGPSGAGKSTILQLLLRFYDISQGEVTIDNIDIRKLKLEQLRKQFAYVSQETVIFSSSALENIKYGNIDASKEEIITAAKTARAHDFINNLPEGFDTFLGEKGVRLSGGEKQRIAIARAILKNPKILLLDEATSALDAENEKLVQEAIDKLMANRTTIVIAHRLSTVLKADKIIVLDNGEIKATGTHDELMNNSDIYKRLAELQLSA